MHVTKFTIMHTGLDGSVNIPLSSSDDFTGQQQEVDTLTDSTSMELINAIVDAEVYKFKYSPSEEAIDILYYFYDNGYGAYFTKAGFTSDEISIFDRKVLNSFFILEVYDSYDMYNQNLIFTTYLTKILNNGITDPTSTLYTRPIYRIHNDTINQLYNWYIPNSYIDNQLNSGNTVATCYALFKFYNAKTGKVISFSNGDNSNLVTNEAIFFKAELNLLNRTWKFFPKTPPNIRAYEMNPTINEKFVNKVDNRMDKFSELKQTFPTGNEFKDEDGTYNTRE